MELFSIRIQRTFQLVSTPKKFEESREYGNFVTNLMDYNVDCENKGASTVLSGWGHYIIKSRSS